MIANLLRRPLMWSVIALLVLMTILSSVIIVPETRQAVIVRFGKPERILNRYQVGQPIGATGAGINWKLPFVDQVVWIDAVHRKEWGPMVALKGTDIVSVKLADATSEIKSVPRERWDEAAILFG